MTTETRNNPKYYIPELILSDYSHLPNKLLENIGVFVTNHLYRRNNTDNVDLHYCSEILIKVFTQKYWYNELKPIIENIFDINPYYRHNQSQAYKLKERYNSCEVLYKEFTDKVAIKRHLKNIKNAQEGIKIRNENNKKKNIIGSGKNLFENAYLIENLTKIKINEEIFEYIRKQRKILLENKKSTMMYIHFSDKEIKKINSELRKLQNLEYQALRIKNIAEDEFLLNENENTGRIYSIFTNLNKIIRYNYLIFPTNTTEIDIKTSFPTCIPILIQKVNKHHSDFFCFTNDIELQKYINFIKTEDFYSLFVTNKLNRDSVKRKVYNSFISCSIKIMNYSPIAKKFKSEFPDIYKFIIQYKKKYGYKEFMLELSRIEASIINPIARKYAKNDFVLSLFDAIYCDSKITTEINNDIISEFNKYGVQAKTEIKEIYQLGITEDTTISKPVLEYKSVEWFEEQFRLADERNKQNKDPSLGLAYGYY